VLVACWELKQLEAAYQKTHKEEEREMFPPACRMCGHFADDCANHRQIPEDSWTEEQIGNRSYRVRFSEDEVTVRFYQKGSPPSSPLMVRQSGK